MSLMKRDVGLFQSEFQSLRHDPTSLPMEVKMVGGHPSVSARFHQLVLVASSPLLRDIFEEEQILFHEDVVTIIMPDFGEQEFDKLGRFLYGEVDHNEEEVWSHPILHCLRIGDDWEIKKQKKIFKKDRDSIMYPIVNVKVEPDEYQQPEFRRENNFKDRMNYYGDYDEEEDLFMDDFEDKSNVKGGSQMRWDSKLNYIELKDGSWQCVLCSEVYYDRYLFKNHYEEMHDMEDSNFMFRGHETMETENNTQAKKSTSSSAATRRNRKAKAKKRVGCAGCGQVFQGARALRFHLLHDVKQCPNGRNETFVCDTCEAVIYDANKFEIHKRNHEEGKDENSGDSYDDDGERKVFKSEPKEPKEPKQPAEKHLCPKCPKTFDYLKSLMNHIDNHDKIDSQGQRVYKCKLCDRVFNNKSSLHYHKEKHNPEGFKCTKCPRSFKSKKGLRYHLKLHDGIADYLCDDCGKGFITKQKLLNHRRAKHTFEKPYICDQCGVGFVCSDKLVVHKRRVHTGEKPYKCEECNWRGVDSSSLIHHRKRHKGEAAKKEKAAAAAAAAAAANSASYPSHVPNQNLASTSASPMMSAGDAGMPMPAAALLASRYMANHLIGQHHPHH